MRVLWQVFTSTLAAFFGVQSNANRRRDFQNHSPLAYIAMGIIMAVVLVFSLVLLVNQVLA
ncbi:DUF2970 domain-containing protein [Shewanella sp. SR44-3]|uniref:DUF2970 domain-containing protein n=1 Tax=unclassified Shewanella TaxID=196818 RepID=UPI0015FD7F2F|nr:DUF2970 domain-containing protein [Shewanella sp. SR44-3]MBB1269391.1 DUF2970 domain-containing protein [Shewanella sp. SR44-3]